MSHCYFFPPFRLPGNKLVLTQPPVFNNHILYFFNSAGMAAFYTSYFSINAK